MKVYILGICGTAMASLAKILIQKGHEVLGSDQNCYSPMSDFLDQNQITYFQPFDVKNIQNTQPDLCIIGNAICRGNIELEYILEHKIKFYSFPEALRSFFLWESDNIVVTGTHGKTTTSSMIASVFNQLIGDVSYLIGGIPIDLLNSASYFEKSKYFILEGDEYDSAFFDKRSKFIHYLPDTLVINNIEYDHADIFESLSDIQKSFHHLVRTLSKKSMIIYNGDDPDIQTALKENYSQSFSFGEKQGNDLRIEYLGKKGKFYRGYFYFQNQQFLVELKIAGKYNFFNAAAAFLVSRHYNLKQNRVLEALREFSGVKRRLNKTYDKNNLIIIDDFAHHPTAIENTIAAVKQDYPDYELIYCQDLSSNTTYRKIHQAEYNLVFSLVDHLIFKVNPKIDNLAPDERLDLSSLKSRYLDKNCEVYFDVAAVLQNTIERIVNNKKQVIVFAGSGSTQSKLLIDNQLFKNKVE